MINLLILRSETEVRTMYFWDKKTWERKKIITLSMMVTYPTWQCVTWSAVEPMLVKDVHYETCYPGHQNTLRHTNCWQCLLQTKEQQDTHLGVLSRLHACHVTCWCALQLGSSNCRTVRCFTIYPIFFLYRLPSVTTHNSIIRNGHSLHCRHTCSLNSTPTANCSTHRTPPNAVFHTTSLPSNTQFPKMVRLCSPIFHLDHFGSRNMRG